MPSLTLPLLSPPTTTDVSSPTPKKTPKKLRRKNPPPSLTTAHQRLPSSAGSSTYSRPSSSKSNPPDASHQAWTASHPASQQGRRGSEPRAGDWSAQTGDFPLGHPPPIPAALYSGLMTPPPESEVRQGKQIQVEVQMQGQQQQNQNQNPGASPRSVSSVYSSPPASSNQERFPANVQQTPQTVQHVQQPAIHASPPPQVIRGKGRDAFKAFSYDSYNSPSVPPSTSSSLLPPPPPLPQISYIPNAQHPNNLFASVSPPPANNYNTTTNMHTRSKTLPSNLDLTDLAPPPRILARTPNGSPILPPLPSFQSGGFGFDLPGVATGAAAANNAINKNDNTAHHQPKASPTYSGRQKYRPTSLPSPTAPPVPDRKRPSMYFHPEPEPAPAGESAEPAQQGEYICHAITAEEPIALPSSAEHTPSPSPPTANEEFEQQPPAKGRVRRKSDAVSSFLGGWKLTMMGGGNSSSTARNEKALSSGSESDVSPVGVGDGGGWIHRRKGSFSSTRPPSRERSKHGAYAQEYKEFRAQKAAESATASSKRASQTALREGSVAPVAPASPVEGTGVSGILGGMATRERNAEKAKEGRRTKRESGRYSSSSDSSAPPVPVVDPSKIASASDVVSLDVAVRQMQLLESQLKKGRPLSPPDSRDGEKSESDRGYQASSEYSQTTAATNSRQGSADSSQQNSGSSSPAGSINQKFQVLPASQASSSKQQQVSDSTGKGKSRSPLRNEIDSESVSGDEKKKLEQPKSMGKHSSSSSTIKQQQDYFSRPKSSGAALESGSAGSSGSRPPTPPKPIAKLFVICCRCKYWHDLPSVMYRGMVENGGATRCPYCLHGMEVSCCAG
ncbi:uncharacterized protein H6S33_012021 [Morchella sextelata]|uniref:uncharacterized protein n=1 Tax=Morchella sextelata TaxID=1174677 RepID=UPI001D04B559|nr:uncharacterized protein H6S33_012021 [Morchella sextelata]KAH0610494.1 hypothetical protein H6S33_012021 [Morchella sextelata]